ncbi:glycogen synthase [Tenacibaculum sp. UWU-22]|uniref:glycogen synthase n=1 Tax=Tenacibaculum sp. UWU-22 TaxID=3234187 RepID=UPI0034DB4260
MNIVHISAECYPIAKVGGLADVVGSLPKYQNALGVEACVIMPFYDLTFTKKHKFSKLYSNTVKLGSTSFDFRVLKLESSELGFTLFLIDVKELLFKDYVYSFDDTDRFLAFQKAVLDWLLTFKEKPSIIHCHDHHTALIPFMLQECYRYRPLNNIPTVLTIHNAQYQGWFDYDKLSYIPDFNVDNVGLLDWDGVINPLATGIKCAWRVTTVSPTYMEELKQKANGLESLLTAEKKKCLGILNGIDVEVWNPEKDAYLVKKYTVRNNISGKKANKKYLCEKFKLHKNKPLFIFIGRLVGEKGADLLPEVFTKVLADKNCTVLVLGSGNKDIEKELYKLQSGYSGHYNAYTGYNEKLSHIMYAGADFLLMPSRVEPCGLNQMYSLKYGTIPVVRSIGGLKDTVIDITKKNGFGICHKEATVAAIIKAVKKAITLYDDNQQEYRKISKKIMQIDHSWNTSAEAYITLYKSII